MDFKKSALILFGILIIASFFRLNQLKTTPPGLYSDEAVNGNNAAQAILEKDYKVFYPENNGREGLFMNIQSVSMRIFGHEPWALRLPSAIFGILTVLGMYFLGKELFSKQIGLASSFLLAVSFWHINFSRIGFRAIMSPLFLIWGIYFLIHAFKNSGIKKKTSLFFAILGGVMYGLGFYSYIAYRVTPILVLGIIAYFIARKWGEKNVLYVSGLFLLTTFMVALPIGLYFLDNPQDFMGRTSQISVFSAPNPIGYALENTIKTLGMFNFIGDFNWRHNYAGHPQLFIPVGIFFIAGLAYSVAGLFKNKNRFEFLVILGMFILAFGPVIISNEGLPHALRAILMIPAVFLLSGIGFVKLYEYSKKHIHSPWRGVAMGLVILILIAEAYISYFVLWANKPEVASAFNKDYTEMSYVIRSLPNEKTKFIIYETNGGQRPMSAEIIMYLTDSYLPIKQFNKNIYYVSKDKEPLLPAGVIKFYIK